MDLYIDPEGFFCVVLGFEARTVCILVSTLPLSYSPGLGPKRILKQDGILCQSLQNEVL